MRRLSVQAARWHHYGVSTTHIKHASLCLLPRRAFSCSPFRRSDDREPKVTIKHYEQSTLTSKDRVEIDPEADVREEQEFLKRKIEQLEKELEFLKEGPFGPRSPLMKSLPPADRERALKALRKFDEEHRHEAEELDKEEAEVDAELDQLIEEEFGGMAKEEEELWDPTKRVEEPKSPPKEPFEVELKVPETQQAYVDRFNKTLKALAGNATIAQKQDAWRSYRRCKESLPFFLEIVPDEALKMLWDSQAPRTVADRTRPSHLETLAEDMISNKRELTYTQWMEYLELLYRDRKSTKALPLWENCQDLVWNHGPKENNRFWQLGVKLMVANGELQRAQDQAISFLEADKEHDARILIPIIIAWAQRPESDGDGRAWTLYLKLKTMIGNEMKMDDYDELSVGFLKAGKTSLALAVFKDMMLTGQDSKADSSTLYKASMGLVGNLHASSITESDVNKISLAALTFLPRRFQNKFFYGSWMKKLIGMGEIDSAAKVVELMYERGVKPDPKHLNGIMGAWLREGSPSARDKAERLGWAMIQERIDQVWQGPSTKPSVHDPETGAGVPHFMQRRVPPANIETFSVLLLHYTRRNQEHLVSYLVQCLENAKVKPNTFFMNHLLYKELRQQNIYGVWEGYQEIKNTVKPDLETYACLWDTGKLQYDRTRSQYDSRFPTARQVYYEMMEWYNSLTPFHQNATRENFSRELYEQIIRCFCLSFDLHGALVALRSLKSIFGFFPDVDTIRILLFLIVRLAPNPDGTPRSRRRRITATPRARENLEYATQLIDVLRDQKTGTLFEQGIEVEELSEEEKKQFEVDLMSDVLRVVMRRLTNDNEAVEEKIRETAVEMGVPDLDLGQPLSIEV
ncbi:hypothetical protein VTO42DRAFT_6623 [Malbranchea cinnamomea]